ncbi:MULTISPECIES: GntR family transcriptional regulator [Pseudomonadaceae]|jgi:GntR family transcriptional regulator|uniref:GntR family transcriptional regulator n=1 Tax=Pseudomonadaceae TaxID=135621 RepID=UPI001C63672C|nr:MULTISPECIES: GntR family transcriptional regulator [Pseudomonadaceae]
MDAPKGPIFQPLYQQIRDLLLERITSGEWSPGTYIPSEAALAASYNVSVGTLRKALNELVEENVVIRQQGKGTSVATHDADRALFRFFNLRRHDGERALPMSLILNRSVRKATAEEASDLGIPAGAKVIHIRRVRELDREPVLLESITLDAARFAGLDKQPEVLPNTLYQLYQQRFGMTVAHADETIIAISAGKQEVEFLGVKEGEPLLQVRRIARDYQGVAIERRISAVHTGNYGYFHQI